MRRSYLQELLTITNQQHTYLFCDEYQKFIDLLDERQEIMDEIEKINRDNPQSLNGEERKLLNEIKKVDDENRREFDRQFEEVKEELRKLNMSQKREDSYINPYASVYEMGRTYGYDGKR